MTSQNLYKEPEINSVIGISRDFNLTKNDIDKSSAIKLDCPQCGQFQQIQSVFCPHSKAERRVWQRGLPILRHSSQNSSLIGSFKCLISVWIIIFSPFLIYKS